MSELAKKKILYVITKSNWGGAQAYVYALACRFKEAGAETAVALGGTGVAGAGAGLLAERLAEAGIRTIFVKAFKRDMGFLTEFRALFELVAVLRRERPDVLHLNSSKAGGLGALAGRLTGVKRIVFTAHGWAHQEEVSQLSRAFRWLLSWLTILFAHQVIVLSHDELRAAPSWGLRKKLVRIYNGMSPFSLRAPSEARREITAQVPGALSDPLALPFWYLALGELHPNKGLDVLIRAFTEVARAHSDAALVIVGEGAQRIELEELVNTEGPAGRVFFAGFVPNAREFLSAADVFVLASRKEGLPFVVLEAGMARLPVVATRVGALPEVIEDEVSGLLVPKNSVAFLTTALLRMYEDEALRTRAGLALHARVIRDFSEEIMLLETARVYL